MKRITFSAILAFMFVLMTVNASGAGLALVQIAKPEPLVFSFTDWDTDYTITLGMTASELESLFDRKSSESRMPYWGDPETLSPEKMGYTLGSMSHFGKSGGYSISNINLYCSYDLTDEGFNTNKDDAKLYLIQYEIDDWEFKEDEFNQMVDEYTTKYGNPVFNDYITTGLLFHNGVRTTSRTHNISYVWDRIDNTGIRLSASYEEHIGSWDDITVNYGRTDLDPSLYAGKSVKGPSFIQVSVQNDYISVWDENGNYSRSLENGSKLLILSYEASDDAFKAHYTYGDSGIDISGGSINIYSTISGDEGYINGNGLSITRDVLLRHFR